MAHRTPGTWSGRNLRLYYAYGMVSNFLLWSGIWIKYLLDERDLELKWILAMDLPFWLLVALLQAPTGALADHIGRRRVMALGSVLMSVTILGFGFTTNYWMLFADYCLWAVAMALQSGADQALVYDTLKADGDEGRFARVQGRGFGLGLAAATVAVVLGSVLADATSLAFVVQLSALAPLTAAGIALAMCEPPLERAERRYWAGMRAAVTFAWQTPTVRYMLLISAVFLTATFGPVVLVQPFLLHHDVDTAFFGVLQAPLRLTSAVAAIVAFRLATRTSLDRILWVNAAAIFTAYAGLALLDSSLAFAFFLLPGFVQGLSTPVTGAYLNARLPSDRRATVLSLVQLAFALQVAFYEPALGFVTDDISLAAAFWFAGVYFALAMPPLLVLWRRAARGESLPVVEPLTVPPPLAATADSR